MRHYEISFVTSQDKQGVDIIFSPTIMFSKMTNPTIPNMIWIMWLMWGIEIKISKH